MTAELQVKNEQSVRVRCPKNLKMPKMVKIYGALGPFKTKESRNHYMRSTATAIHEDMHKSKRSYGTNARSASDSSSRAIAEEKANTKEV